MDSITIGYWPSYARVNVFAYPLVADEVPPAPEKTPTKFVVDDNIGESIHVHLRNTRLEFGVTEFDEFAENVVAARENLDAAESDGNR